MSISFKSLQKVLTSPHQAPPFSEKLGRAVSEKYLDDVFMGDKDKIIFAQESIGYAFLKEIQYVSDFLTMYSIDPKSLDFKIGR